MNAQNAHEYLPLVQALADGKTLQYLHDNEWYDYAEDKEFWFNTDASLYRIKSEPIEYEVWKGKQTGILYPLTSDDVDYDPNEFERITIREILKPESGSEQPVAEPAFDWAAFWKDAPEWCEYVAMDEDGYWYYSESKPKLFKESDGGYWGDSKKYPVSVADDKSPPTCIDWTQSLIKNPNK